MKSAREFGHELSGCRGGTEYRHHSERCDLFTAAIEARDAEAGGAPVARAVDRIVAWLATQAELDQRNQNVLLWVRDKIRATFADDEAAQPQPRDAGAVEDELAATVRDYNELRDHADRIQERLSDANDLLARWEYRNREPSRVADDTREWMRDRKRGRAPAVKRADVVPIDEAMFSHLHRQLYAAQKALATRDEMFARWLRWALDGRFATSPREAREKWIEEKIESGSWLADLDALDDKKPRDPGCKCHMEEGDSECPVHDATLGETTKETT